MYNTELTRRIFAEHAVKIPASLYFSIDDREGKRGRVAETLELQVHTHTQDDVKALRAAFPGSVWRKKRCDSLDWWEYSAKLDEHTTIVAIACKEAPATCRQVTEEVEVMERVPVEFAEEMQPVQVPTRYEERAVTKTVTKWVCDQAETEKETVGT